MSKIRGLLGHAAGSAPLTSPPPVQTRHEQFPFPRPKREFSEHAARHRQTPCHRFHNVHQLRAKAHTLEPGVHHDLVQVADRLAIVGLKPEVGIGCRGRGPVRLLCLNHNKAR
eukprot:230278-Chlamydomonas_euryale.AAC.9